MTVTTPRHPRDRSMRAITALAAIAVLAPTSGSAAGAPATNSAAAALISGVQAPERESFIAVDAAEILITNVKIIDGTGVVPRDNQTVLIRNGRIIAIGDAGTVSASADAEVIDGSGHTLIPGLVGLHNHSFYQATGGYMAQLSITAPIMYLASGVTTIRTTGAISPYEELNLKAEIDGGLRIGPRVVVTGPYINGPAGALGDTKVNNAEDARRVVRYWAEEGVSWIKAYMHISREALGAAIDEAHEHGIKVTAHLCSVTFREAVALGIDNLEHGLVANTDYVGGKQPDLCPEAAVRYAEQVDLDMSSDAVQATFREMIDAGVSMTSTMAINEMYVPGRPPVEQRALDMMAPHIAAVVKAENDRYVNAPEDNDFPRSPEWFLKALEYEAAFVRAGGLLASGVDPTGYGAALPGFGDQRNFEILREADFTPQEVIQILSVNGAKVLDIDDQTGTIEVGKLAEMVLIKGDLAADPEVIRNVIIVFKDGVGYDSAAMLASIKGQVGIH